MKHFEFHQRTNKLEGEGGPAEFGVIGDDDDAAGRPHEGGVDDGLALVGGVEAVVVHALHAEEQGADGDLGEDERGQGAGELVGAGAGGAAGDDDAHALAHGELAGYVDRLPFASCGSTVIWTLLPGLTALRSGLPGSNCMFTPAGTATFTS